MGETVSSSVRVLPPPAQRVVPVFEAIASHAGAPLRAHTRILDFGAGAGRHVAEFREAGYEHTLGVDQSFESHSEGAVEDEFLRRVDPPDYELPFGDGVFDFVFSTVVMEHVLDPARALAEIARVLRPGGLSVHVFPARWRPVEPHMFVPFGGRFQSYWTLRLWAALGVRSGFQREMSAREVALSNVQYCKTGLSYPTAHEWSLWARPLFSRVGWDEATFVRATRTVSRASRLFAPFLAVPGAERAYRGFHTRVLVLER
jgi:SAM-dependent methyltransferase